MKTVKPTRNRLLALATVLPAAGILLVLLQPAAPESDLPNNIPSGIALEAGSEPLEDFHANGIGEAVVPQAETAPALGNENTIDAPSRATIDVKFIQRALQRVKVGDEGDVVLDHDALQALYDGVGYGGLRLSGDQLLHVQDIIRKGLPDKAGEQAAGTVGNFYRYLEAKKQVDQLYQHSDSAAEQRFKVEDLRSLRRLAFGVDQAELLFSRQEAHEDYMLANMAVSLDETLTEKERQQRRKVLKKEFLEADYGILNWSARGDNFLQQKKAILNTSLSATEKSAQIDALLAQQFTSDEAERVEHLNLAEF